MSAPACKCGHRRDVHGLDRKRRPTCFGSALCGCGQFREPGPKTDTPSLREYLASKGRI